MDLTDVFQNQYTYLSIPHIQNASRVLKFAIPRHRNPYIDDDVKNPYNYDRK